MVILLFLTIHYGLYLNQAPDLVVEIPLPATLKRDKIDKLQTYAFYRIPEYWIIEPKTGALEQFMLSSDRYQLISIFRGVKSFNQQTFLVFRLQWMRLWRKFQRNCCKSIVQY
jgi:Uma2 family endonuclease